MGAFAIYHPTDSREAIELIDDAPMLLIVGIAVAFLVGLALFIALLNWGGDKQDDASGMIGRRGVAQETFTQEGVVLVQGELWRATSNGGIINKGASVEVLGLQPGLLLVVRLTQE